MAHSSRGRAHLSSCYIEAAPPFSCLGMPYVLAARHIPRCPILEADMPRYNTKIASKCSQRAGLLPHVVFYFFEPRMARDFRERSYEKSKVDVSVVAGAMTRD